VASMVDRHFGHTRMTPETLRGIVALALART
jgi:hypothetical protein